MIKGVNRQIVEVRDAKSEYFERVLFFVKPEYASTSEARLYEKAKQFTDSASAPPITRKSNKTDKKEKSDIILSLARFIAYASIGALITALAFYL
ncbi:MAG: hypothetical protein K5917_03930 [Clostridiales bacterium]|nr:hypothetical protein [Clostridiales bacterium]